jgi:hypothetical protein
MFLLPALFALAAAALIAWTSWRASLTTRWLKGASHEPAETQLGQGIALTVDGRRVQLVAVPATPFKSIVAVDVEADVPRAELSGRIARAREAHGALHLLAPVKSIQARPGIVRFVLRARRSSQPTAIAERAVHLARILEHGAELDAEGPPTGLPVAVRATGV